MSGPTPGPWEATGASVQTHRGATDTLIAVTKTHDIGGEEAEANACLIAAAPELLAALKVAERIMDEADFDDGPDETAIQAIREARDAIAKAEGR